ncbi:MAG: hypothetical protein WC301_03675 [Candidatus Omnitrophota bacterium]
MEFILKIYNASVETLRDSIAEFGDEIEVMELPRDNEGKGRDFRIRMRAEDPTIIFDTCAQFGRLGSVKVNDLKEGKDG